MNEILSIILAMLCVYGFYAALCEVRSFCLRLVCKRQKKIDKEYEKEYNNIHTE